MFMSVLRRIMLSGIDISTIPESNKIYYTATAKVDPLSNSLGSRVLLNTYSTKNGEGVIVTVNPINTIGDSAFSGKECLTSIKLPDTVKKIGINAFKDTTNLLDLFLQTGNAEFLKDAFYNTGIETVHVPSYPYGYNNGFDMLCTNKGSNEYSSPFFCNNAKISNDSNVTVTSATITNNIEKYSLAGVSELKQIMVDMSKKELIINPFAFYKSPSKLYFPISSINTVIGTSAFENSGVYSVGTLEGVSELGASAFRNCNLGGTREVIHISANTIGTSCFIGSALNNIVIDNSVKEIENYAFSRGLTSFGTTIQSLRIDINIFEENTFRGYVFEGCVINNLELNGTLYEHDISRHGFTGATIHNISFGDNVTSIASNSFLYCDFTQDVLELPTNISSIGNRAFCDIYANKVLIPNSITNIGEEAFYNCIVDYISVGAGITNIPYRAFYSPYIKVLDFSSHTVVPECAKNSVFVINSANIIVPDNLYDIWISAYVWKDLANRIIKKSDWDSRPRKGAGVYIQHTNGWLYTIDEWSSHEFISNDANGVAVISDKAKFVISKKNVEESEWALNSDTIIYGASDVESISAANADLQGIINTSFIAARSKSSAAQYSSQYRFPDTRKGYLPSMGEWVIAHKYKNEIDSAMNAINGDDILSGAADYPTLYWTSTKIKGKAGVISWDDYLVRSSVNIDDFETIRPFAKLTLL